MQLDDHDRPSLSSSLREVAFGVKQVVRSEIQLARAELGETGRHIGKQLTRAVVFGFIAMLGIIPFIAFLVIGLGKLINNNYLVSSLLVSLVFVLIGLPMALRALRTLRGENLLLPRTRETMGRSMLELKEVESAFRASGKERRVAS